MALQKQTIEIPLGVGVDTKADTKQLQPGKLLALENGCFEKTGKLNKRFGLLALARTTLDSLTTGIGRALTAFKSELNLIAGTEFFSYFPARNVWSKKGNLIAVKIETDIIARPASLSSSIFCTAAGAGLILYSSDIGISVFDQSTGQSISNFALTGAVRPGGMFYAPNGFFAPSGLFYIYTASPAEVFVTTFNPATYTLSSATLVHTIAGSGTIPVVHARIFGSQIIVLIHNLISCVVGIADATGLYIAPPTVVTTGVLATSNITGANLFGTFSANPSVDAIYVVYSQTSGASTVLTGVVYSTTLSVLVGAYTIDTSFPANGVFTISMGRGTFDRALLFYSKRDQVPNAAINVTASRAQLTRAGAIQDTGVVNWGAVPASNPFDVGSAVCLIMYHPSEDDQGQYLVVTSLGETVAAFSYQAAPEAPSYGYLINNVANIFADKFVYCCGRLGRSSGTSALASTQGVTGTQTVSLDFSATKSLIFQTLGETHHIAAGTVWNYDGFSLSEMGFRTFPQKVSVAQTAAGTLVDGTRSFIVIYEFTDARGQVYRSAPSTPVTFTTTAGPRQVEITLSSSIFSSKASNKCLAVIYRTVAGGTTYYRSASTLLNPSSAFKVTTDNISDATLITREILYTTGGVLENIPPPCASFVMQHGNRLFLVGLEDRNEIWFSRAYLPGESPFFNDALTLRIDAGRGGVVAAGSIDEKIVFFKEDSIFYTTGQGPNDTGQNNDYNQPQLISVEVGCSEPKSLVQFPGGIVFKSLNGFYLIDRGLNTGYIGAPVEDFNHLTVTSTVHLEVQSQIRFTHSDGVTLVYDYNMQQWSTFTNYTAVSGTEWKNSHAILRNSGTVDVENSPSFIDNGVAVPIRIETPWIPLAGLQGFQRVYEASFLGENISAHTLRVRIAYDYDNAWVETVSAPSTVLSNDVEQLKVRPARQKCQSIKFEVTDLNPLLFGGACISLSSMSLTIGVKGGINRTKSGQVMT